MRCVGYATQVRPSRPSGDVIDRVHKRWWGDYKKLEAHHGYIQWLFPLFEGGGMNYQSARLTKGEGTYIAVASPVWHSPTPHNSNPHFHRLLATRFSQVDAGERTDRHARGQVLSAHGMLTR